MRGKRISKSVDDKIEKRIIKRASIVLVIFIFIIFSISIFLTQNKTKSVKYYEKGNVDYNISLNKNEFFEEETLPANNQYISSIINTINVDFKYDLQMKEQDFNDYKYQYKIEAQTKIIEKTTQNNIYDFKDVIKEEKGEPEKGKFALDENIAIDYKKYDLMAKKIITAYDLNNIECKTVVTLYVDLLDANDNVKNTSTIKVNIPLNAKTVNIDVENNIDNTEEKDFVKEQPAKTSWIFLIITILLIIIEFINSKKLIKDIKKNYSKEEKADIEVKKILKEYGPYIQKVSNGFDFGKYDMISVENFENLLRIGEIVQSPILMIENETKTKTYFIVITTNSVMYSYEINHGDVKELTC